MAMSSQYIELIEASSHVEFKFWFDSHFFIIFHYPQLYYIIHDYYGMADKIVSEHLFTILFLFLLSNMYSAFWEETDDDDKNEQK